MSRTSRFARGFGWRAGLVLGSIVITLLIAEGFAWLFVPAEVDAFFTPFVHDDSSFTTSAKDPELLYTLAWYIPGATGVTGTAPVRINNLGLRDEHDYPEVKPAGCYRVLGLGDSMTFGKGVAAEETFLAVLEQQLRLRYDGRCVEVLNAGMPNTNFFVQWLHYKFQWHRFKPDLVLVNFFVYNDTQLEHEEEPYSLHWMEFVDRNPWLKSSSLIRWVYHRAFFDMGSTALDEGLPRFFDPEYAGWQEFERALESFKEMAKSEGSRVAFALVPIPEGYDDYPYRDYHDKLIDVLLTRYQLPVFDIVRGLGGIRARDHWVHPSDGHPDAFLHREMGMFLANAIPWDTWMRQGVGQ